jgi:hypothetical protein
MTPFRTSLHSGSIGPMQATAINVLFPPLHVASDLPDSVFESALDCGVGKP